MFQAVLCEGPRRNAIRCFNGLVRGGGGGKGSERKGSQGMKVEDAKEMIPFDFQRAFALVLSGCLKIRLCRSKVKRQRHLGTSFSKR
jgi:hypothetical protein